MTICIAAIGKENGSEFVVFATDHMLTHPTIGQFEHPIDKYKVLNKECIAMFSGIPTYFSEICKTMKKNDEGIEKMALNIHEAMIELRKQEIDRKLLKTYGVDWSFVKSNLEKPFQNKVINIIMESIAAFTLNSSILLAGFNGDEAVIAEINERNIANERDINFSAIGSGAVQALNTLLFQQHSKEANLSTTLYDVYKAKRNAEVSKGVGRATDVLVLFKGKDLIELTENQKEELSKVYSAEFMVGNNSKELKELGTKIWQQLKK